MHRQRGCWAHYPQAIVEKDVHITDALRALSQVRLAHTAERLKRDKGGPSPTRQDVATHLVFAGGTCLSKARQLIERMSEDIDVKVVLDPVPDGYALPKQQGGRKRLGDLHNEVDNAYGSLVSLTLQSPRTPTPAFTATAATTNWLSPMTRNSMMPLAY